MFCGQCGKQVPDGAKFCNFCGAAAIAPRPEPALGGGAASSAAADAAQGLLARVKNILLSPATEWPVVAAESTSARAIYLGYVAPLVAIGVIATFIGHSVIGVPLLGRLGIAASLAQAVLTFLLSFLGVFLLALIVDLLAQSFGGQRDSLAA